MRRSIRHARLAAFFILAQAVMISPSADKLNAALGRVTSTDANSVEPTITKGRKVGKSEGRKVKTTERTKIESPNPPLIVAVHRYVLGDSSSLAGAAAWPLADGETATKDRLVYSNTLGQSVRAGFGTDFRVADDLFTTATDGCLLSRFEFLVSGTIDGKGEGPFAVEFALYDACLRADGLRLAGTRGRVELPDEGLYLIDVRVPDEVAIPLPNPVWLSVSFDRQFAGWVGGAPALVGYSDDTYEDSFLGCTTSLGGGYPGAPHGSFHVQIYVRDGCSPSFLGYRASTPRESTLVPGADVRIAEDIEVEAEGCELLGYEVAVRGSGTYQLDLRSAQDGGEGPGEVIPGTEVMRTVSGNRLKLMGRTFDPPLAMPSRFWVTLESDGRSSRVVVVGRPVNIGRTDGTYAVLREAGWELEQLSAGADGQALHVSVRCAGSAPVGACCDMMFTDEDGESVCREVSRANCPFPRWLPDAVCQPDPFRPFCGTSACCLADGSCENRTEKGCARGGVSWSRGAFCDAPDTDCPEICVVSDEPCSVAHDGPGCVDPSCCAVVCDQLDGGFCCERFWDDTCVGLAALFCDNPPSNDQCAPTVVLDGAQLLDIFDDVEASGLRATDDPDDPGFCCHSGFPLCVGGANRGSACLVDANCPDGSCVSDGPLPGTQGYGSLWYRFEIPERVSPDEPEFVSVQLSTCASSAPALDSLIQVFSIRDSDRGVCKDLGRCFDGAACMPSTQDCADGTRCVDSVEACRVSAGDCPAGAICELDLEAACREPAVIACGDDTAGCSSSGRNTRLCLPDLTRGETYLILLASKTPDTVGNYRLDIRDVSSCPNPGAPNDYCPYALPVTDGVTPFDLTAAVFDCAYDACGALIGPDLWFEYTPSITGRATLAAQASDDGSSLAARLAVYDGCDCPPDDVALRACGADDGIDGGSGSRVSISVQQGRCYKIRVGLERMELNNVERMAQSFEGNLTIMSSADDPCPEGVVSWIDPPDGVVDARRPHDPKDSSKRLGIDSFVVRGPAGADVVDCWSLCETLEPAPRNVVWSVSDNGAGLFTLHLARPITDGAQTTITYTSQGLAETTGRFTAHPANVNGDPEASPDDLLDLIAILGGTTQSRWGIYSEDLDRSGALGPADLLEIVDLLNGAAAYRPWNNTPLPAHAASCP